MAAARRSSSRRAGPGSSLKPRTTRASSAARTLSLAELHIHKQTLGYRIRRIEQITGRGLTRTEHIAEWWIALRAHDLLTGRNPSLRPARTALAAHSDGQPRAARAVLAPPDRPALPARRAFPARRPAFWR